MNATSRRLRIWLVTVGEPLPLYSIGDRQWRCGYLAELLAARGHDVTWWSSTFDHFRKRHFESVETIVPVSDGLRLILLHGRAYNKNISVSRYLNHREIAEGFRLLSRIQAAPDVIAASFPPIELCSAAIAYARQQGIPAFVDIRDLWPDEFVRRIPRILEPIAKLALQPLYRQTAQIMRDAYGIIGISESYRRWGLSQSGRRRGQWDRVIPLGYTGIDRSGGRSPTTMERLAQLGVDANKKIFWFCGTFVRNIDLLTVIEAATLLKERLDLQFVLTGDGERASEFHEEAQGRHNVVFTGWLGSADIAGMASIAYVGLAAYEAGASMTLPNKLFEYMSSGLPVLCCLKGETAELINQNALGLLYTPGDAADLARQIVRMADDPELRKQMADKAIALFRQKYSAEAIYNDYSSLLESAATSHYKC